MKVIKRILIIITTVILINVSLMMSKLSSEEAASSVNLSIVTQPYIDVVLSKSKTETNLESFKNDLLNSLKSKGVKTEDNWVKVTDVESHKVNIQDAFEWKQDVSSDIGNITITEGGKNVEMVGNYSNPGKNAIWITPTEDLDQIFTFDYSIEFGDSFNAAGMLLRVKEQEDVLTGYMLSFNNTSGQNWYSAAGGASGAIWRFTYYRNNNSDNIIKSLVRTLPISTTGTLTVRASRTEIEVSGGGLDKTQVCDLDDPMGTGFGFFSDHYSHGCNRYGNFSLENINLKTESSKRLEEVLRAPDWRENSIKVLVNVGDYENKQLSQPGTLGELLTRMINDEIYYCGWGNDVNKDQTNQLIAANNNKGKFINNTSYSNSIDQTAAYIKTLLPTASGTNYIVLGDNTFLSSANSSLMKNTAYGSYPNGRWKILHDCEYYENNLGQFQKSGRYLSNMITSFDKTGKYEITYEDNPTSPNIIYVHRRPVAEIEVQRSGTNITLVSKGFDWDHRSEANHGVVQEEWKWRKVGETTWNNGKLTNISAYDNYLVQLRVKDKEGVWSMPTSKYITKVTDIPPIASFKLENNVLSIYENLVVQDGSYDPYGRTITGREWKVFKDGTEVYKGSTPKLNFMDKGTGNYTMSLTVTNEDGQVSEAYTRNFEIRPDDEAPEVTINPTECNWTGSVDVRYSFKDRLGSGYKSHQYALTNSINTPSTSSWRNGPSTNKITINTPGEWYLHIRSTDGAGNTSEDRVVGVYKIDGIDPTGTLSHTPTTWTNQNVTISYNFTDAESGMKNVKLPDGTTTTTFSGTYTVSQNGTYKFVATDIAGNSAEFTETITNIDKLKPTVTISPNGGNKYVMPTTGNAKITTRLTAADANATTANGKSELKTVQYAWSQSNTTEPTTGWMNFTAAGQTITKSDITRAGTWYLWTKVIDNAGNRASNNEEKATISNAFTIIANTDPRAMITLTPDITRWTNTNVTVNATYGEYLTQNKTLTCNGTANVDYTVNGLVNVVVKTNGKTVTATAEDIAGNRIVKTYQVTNIDKILPVHNITHMPTDWVIDYVTIHWEFTDAQSGMDYVELPNGTTTTETSGTYVVYYNGNYNFAGHDIAGNVKRITKTISNIDKINPEGVLSLSTTDLTDKGLNINWQALDNESGFCKILLPNASISNNANGSYPVDKMGTYTFIIYDVVGNEKELSIQVNNVDVESPNLTVTQKVTRWTNEDIELHWKATDYQSGLKEVVLPNSERREEAEGDYIATQNGIYTFLAYDKVGNGILVRHEVSNIDKIAPLLVLKTKPNDRGNIDIIWEASDNQSGLRNIILPNGEFTSESNGRYETTENGTYTFIAYDNVGNDVFMKIDVDSHDRQGIEFELWQEDAEDGNYKICWRIFDGQDDYKHILLPDNTYSEEKEGYIITKEEGEYTFQSYDRAGNEIIKSIKIKFK